MKTPTRSTRRPFAFGLLLLVCAVLFTGSPGAAAQGGSVPDAELRIKGELRTGQPVKAVFDLKGYKLPAGSYTSINVRFADKPDGTEPEIRTGYPETSLLFHVPGVYRIVFILNEVRKPSCGGVEAKTLLEQTVELEISE